MPEELGTGAVTKSTETFSDDPKREVAVCKVEVKEIFTAQKEEIKQNKKHHPKKKKIQSTHTALEIHVLSSAAAEGSCHLGRPNVLERPNSCTMGHHRTRFHGTAGVLLSYFHSFYKTSGSLQTPLWESLI